MKKGISQVLRKLQKALIEYWVAEKEVKDRRADVAYVKKVFPHTVFRKIKNVGHGGLAPFNPEKFVRGIEKNVGK